MKRQTDGWKISDGGTIRLWLHLVGGQNASAPACRVPSLAGRIAAHDGVTPHRLSVQNSITFLQSREISFERSEQS
jgi:hypothetical protein